jgi:peptidoglycan/LPS O-acetylase OafA/YrhL
MVVRWWQRLERLLPPLGLTVFALFAVTWVTSAGDYLLGE